nr:3-oxoacyl-[acyl-carrier-protein] synthase III C-terminal domain-containing protein [Angustibacter aerolatus]
MAPVAQQALEKAGVSADDLDAFIPHQANMRIVDSLCKTLACPRTCPSRATSPRPATRRRRPSRSRWSGCSARVRHRTAGWRCSSASAPAWRTPPRSSSLP